MTLHRRGSAKLKHEARKAWLLANRDFSIGVPGIHDDVDDVGRARLEVLREVMVRLGLLGTSTQAIQRETIRRLMSELRGERVGVGW